MHACNTDLQININKCKFHVQKTIFLELLISIKELKMNFQKIQAIVDWLTYVTQWFSKYSVEIDLQLRSFVIFVVISFVISLHLHFWVSYSWKYLMTWTRVVIQTAVIIVMAVEIRAAVMSAMTVEIRAVVISAMTATLLEVAIHAKSFVS